MHSGTQAGPGGRTAVDELRQPRLYPSARGLLLMTLVVQRAVKWALTCALTNFAEADIFPMTHHVESAATPAFGGG